MHKWPTDSAPLRAEEVFDQMALTSRAKNRRYVVGLVLVLAVAMMMTGCMDASEDMGAPSDEPSNDMNQLEGSFENEGQPDSEPPADTETGLFPDEDDFPSDPADEY